MIRYKPAKLNPCCLTCSKYKKECRGVTEWSCETSGLMHCHIEASK